MIDFYGAETLILLTLIPLVICGMYTLLQCLERDPEQRMNDGRRR